MNDIEAADVLDTVSICTAAQIEALEHAAKALRERAAAEPVAHISNASLDYLQGFTRDSKRVDAYGYKMDKSLCIPLYTAPPSKPELIEKPLAAGETFESEWVSTDSFYGNE